MLKKITYKEIMTYCELSESSAKRELKMIKDCLCVKKVTLYHLSKYYEVPLEVLKSILKV